MPKSLVTLTKPTSNDLYEGVISSVSKIHIDKQKIHEKVKKMYHWNTIAEKTEKVYDKISKTRKERSEYSLIQKLKRYYRYQI